jgi:hypothetical protein
VFDESDSCGSGGFRQRCAKVAGIEAVLSEPLETAPGEIELREAQNYLLDRKCLVENVVPV